ncbi:MAG: hypothetical protein IJX57_03350 [Clostridia bacterium]|nr:hypothetical protein [Clostridia bacterium]
MEKDKDIIEIIVDETDNSFSGAGKLRNYIAGLENDLSPLFIKVSCSVCVFILIASATVGVFVPKSEKAISDRLLAMQNSDKKYLEAKSTYDTASNSVKDLEKSLEEKQKTLDEFNNSQNNLDKIITDTETLTQKRDELKKQAETKRATLAQAEATISADRTKTVTLISGEYTVGENIAVGKYNVLGSGSIAISRNGKSIANKSLKSDGESFTLNSGDKIVISGNAKFIPE